MLKIKYFPGNTLLHRLDPRTKFLFLILFAFIEVAFLDIRILAIAFTACVLLYLSTKTPFSEVKSTWKLLLTIIVFISSFNALLTFAPIVTFVRPTTVSPHVIGSLWIFKFTWEGVVFILGSLLRLLSFVTATMCVINTTDPTLYAPALAKIGFPYKGAFVVDLALRYLPFYVDELETTMKAQTARGFKARTTGGLLSQIRNTVPLLVPVAINAMLSIYDVADAMELRAFGAERNRTWYRTVSFKRRDFVSTLTLFSLLILAIFLRTRITTYWIPA